MRLSNPWSGLAAPADWKLRWRRWRNRVLAHSGFQRWAARTPLLNRVARARARELFDLVAGFAYSQILLAAVETGLIDLLADGPQSTDRVADSLGFSPEASLRLLRATAALGLTEEVSRDRWTLAGRGAVLHADPGIQAMILHHKLLYHDLANPVALLQADRREPTALSTFWTYGCEQGAETATDYSELMAASQRMVTEQLLAAYPFGRHRAVLDVGGGHGVFISALAAAEPQLQLGLFDLPAVTAVAARNLPERVAVHSGDFFVDSLPSGFDAITLVRILHDHDDAPALALLAAIRKALPAGGKLIIAEPMAGTRGAEAMGDAYFGLYLWAMGSGRPRSATEIRGMLRTAGFGRSEIVRTGQPLIASVIVAA